MIAKVIRSIGQWVPSKTLSGSGVVLEAPTPQTIVNVARDWMTTFPAQTGIKTTGHCSLFEDPCVQWALECLGGVSGKDVLELGPLEGAHTYLLDSGGARSVTAIEANKRSYLKCLLTKEVMNIKNSKFLLGDFVSWLEREQREFDCIWASGVLYHMREPLHLLELISSHTDNVYIWTHYFQDDGRPYHLPFLGKRSVRFTGRDIVHFDRLYFRPRWRALACGGLHAGSSWLKRDDILFALRALGYTRIETAFDDRSTPYRHSFALVARR
jgi:hypothetical protein